MRVGFVKNLWRYPVKSLAGEVCENVRLNERGLEGDRAFAVTDKDGKFGSGKTTRRFRKIDGLLDIHAFYSASQPMIKFADGTVLGYEDPTVHAVLSAAVGQDVRVNAEKEIPHFDAGPVHILTTASLRWLRRHLPNSRIDARRFRPNIVIETEGEDPVEFTWVGKRLKIGSAILQITEPTERCVMTTLHQGDLPKDSDIMRLLNQRLEADFGVYATVVMPGDIKLRDPIERVEVQKTMRDTLGL